MENKIEIDKHKFKDELYYYLVDFLYYNDLVSCCNEYSSCNHEGDIQDRMKIYFDLEDILDICINNKNRIDLLNNDYEFDGDKILIRLRMIDLCTLTKDIDILYNHYIMMVRDQKLKELLGN